jgi:hypothetical protein
MRAAGPSAPLATADNDRQGILMRDAAPEEVFASGEWVEITVDPGDERPAVYAMSATPTGDATSAASRAR